MGKGGEVIDDIFATDVKIKKKKKLRETNFVEHVHKETS